MPQTAQANEGDAHYEQPSAGGSVSPTQAAEEARARITQEYAEALSPLPENLSCQLMRLCDQEDRPTITLHFGFSLTTSEVRVIAQRLIQGGNIQESQAYSTDSQVIADYLNGKLRPPLDPTLPSSYRITDFRLEALRASRWSKPFFQLRPTASGGSDIVIFTLFTTNIIHGLQFKRDRYEEAIQLFKEVAPQREPMWHFDGATYFPRAFGWKPFDAQRVVGQGLSELLAEIA